MNALTSGRAALDITNDELYRVLQTSIYPNAELASIKMAVDYCRAAGLDVLQKPVHLVPMWDSKAGQMRDVVMPGISLYRIQASRTGECAGVSEAEYGPDIEGVVGGLKIVYPAWCRVIVSRTLANGMIATFSAKEFWMENYAIKGGKEKSIAPNAMWSKRPYGQLAKCAEAQALRKAFPELAGAYTAEEMEGKPMHDDAIIDAVKTTVVDPAIVDALESAGESAAALGMESFKNWFTSLDRDSRVIANSFKDGLKAVAQAFDTKQSLAADAALAAQEKGSANV